MASESTGGGLLASLDPESSRRPQALFRDLRAGSPVLRVDGVGVLVTTSDDVDHVLQHPELFSSAMSAAALGNIRPLIPLQIDPPDHRTYRKLLDPLFAPKRMHLLEEPIADLVNEMIDGFAGRTEIDFATEFSIPFPSRVFLTMFGLPVEELPAFLAMKDGIIRAHEIVGTDAGHPAAAAHRDEVAQQIYRYFESILDERLAEPRDDLLSYFLAAEVDGDRLTREEILDICFLFLIAGLDTVSASLECFFGYLVDHPEQRDAIVADLSIVPTVVEELLRWETPVSVVARVAAQDTEVGGCPVAAGEHVMVVLGSANTDDARVTDAADVRWDREANRHLAFGGGIHRCLGSHLARLELRVAMRVWHERIPEYRLAPGAQLVHSQGVRAVASFPMVLGPVP